MSSAKPFRQLNHYFKDYNNLTDSITYGKTYKYSLDKSFIKPYLSGDRFIFQTPALYLPYSPRQVDSYNSGGGIGVGTDNWLLEASLFNGEHDPDIPAFQVWIKGLEDIIYKGLRKRSNLGITRGGHVSLLKNDEYRDCFKLALKLDSKVTNFFMLESQGVIGSKLDFRTGIKVPCYAVFIIEVASIWIRKNNTVLDTVTNTTNSNNWGISLIVHAGQCLHSHIGITPLDPVSIPFIPNSNMSRLAGTGIPGPPPPPPMPPGEYNNISVIPDHLQGYLKMLKLGIPRDAVKQKMALAGHNPAELDNPWNKPGPSSNNTSSGPVKITANMLLGVKLKKGDSQPNTAKPKVQRPAGSFAINLDELLNIKSRLKKAQDSGQDTYSKIFKALDV